MQKSVFFKLAALVLILGLSLGGAAAQAAQNGSKVRLAGTVSAIDLKGDNFTIIDRNENSIKLYVNPATEFEIEKGKDFWGDDDIPFKDLRVGDWVKVKSYQVNDGLEADEVEVYRSE